MSNTLIKINKILAPEIQKLDELIQTHIQAQSYLINEVVDHMKKMTGKRMRVILAFLVAKIYNYSGDDLIKAIASIELIHNATLLHDDVIDNNKKRRGISAANKIWSNKVCILSGDFLLSKAFSLITAINDIKISNLIAQTTSSLVDGEVKQLIYNTGQGDVEYKNYISIIEEKTAVLFVASTLIAPLLSDASEEEIQALSEFSKYLGIAFQIGDDILDYLGSTKNIGKQIGTDYKEKKVTLPTIILKKILYEKGMKDLWDNELWTTKKFKRANLKNVIQLMKKYHVSHVVDQYITEYVNLAKKSVLALQNKKPYYDLLLELIDFVSTRRV
jgi:octaprenyl-diphosphate synthase